MKNMNRKQPIEQNKKITTVPAAGELPDITDPSIENAAAPITLAPQHAKPIFIKQILIINKKITHVRQQDFCQTHS